MAKGYGRRPGMGGGMGGGLNMNMIKQAQKMQQDMAAMQEELEKKAAWSLPQSPAVMY